MPKRSIAKTSDLPSALAIQDTRAALLAAAGLTPERQAELLTKAVSAAEDALGADRTIPLGNGDSATEPDHFSRLAGAKFIRDLLGAAPSKSSSSSGPAQVQVNISLPDWQSPERVNVTPTPPNLGKASE